MQRMLPLMQWNIQILILKLINYNSTIMSKAKNIKQTVIQDSDNESESSVPIVQQKSNKKQQLETKKNAKAVQKAESSEEEETPVVKKQPQKQIKTQNGAAKKVVPVAKKPAKQESSEEESEEEQPKKVVKAKSPAQKPVVAAKKVVKKESSEQEESEQEKPKKIVAKAKSPAQKPIVPAKKKVQQSSQQSESEEEAPKAKITKPATKTTSPALKVKSPVQKPVAKKQAKVESSDESDQSEQVVAPKATQKVKSPVVKAKSPAQKPVVAKKKVQQSSQQSEEEEKPVKKVVPTKAKAVKKVEESEQEEEEQLEAPKNNNHKKVETPKPVATEIDQEGEFQVCVKGLSFQAYQSDVEELFNPFGNVLSVRLLTRDDGKSKGLAFVKFSSKASFNKALQLNGTQQFGRQITVEQSLGKQNQNGGDRGFQRGGNNNKFGGNQGGNKFQSAGNANIENPTLFIGGLSYNSTRESIAAYFSQAGEVASVRIVTDKETGNPRGFGYVEFHDLDTAKKAYQTLNNGRLDGRQIRLDSAAQRDRPQGGAGGFGGQRGGSGGFGGQRGAPRSSNVNLTQDDKNAKKGSIAQFQGKVMNL